MPHEIGKKERGLGDQALPVKLSLKREPLYLVIANQLRSLILKAELKPGSRVHEQQLSELFEVSRTPYVKRLR